MLNKIMSDSRGSVSIFLCIIFLSFVVLAFVLTEAAAIRTAEIQGQRTIDMAVRSVLSEYDRNLKNEFGVFAFAQSEDEIESKIMAYANRMLSQSNIELPLLKEATSLYDFKVEKVSVEKEHLSLNNLSIFKNQLLEYMKYRGPLGYLFDFSSEVGNINKASGALELLNKSAAVFKELVVIDDYINDLRKNSDGWYFNAKKEFATYEPFIKSIGSEGIFQYEESLYGILGESQKEILKEMVYSQNTLKMSSSDYLDTMDSLVKYRCMSAYLDALYNKIIFAKRDVTNEEALVEYNKILNTISSATSELKKKSSKKNVEGYRDFYQMRKESCDRAQTIIRQLKVTVQDINILVKELEAYMSQYDSEILDKVKESVKEDIDSIKELIGENKAVNILDYADESITKNNAILEEVITNFISQSEIKNLEELAENLAMQITTENIDIENIEEKIIKLVRESRSYSLAKARYNKAFNEMLATYDNSYTIEPFSSKQIQELLGENIEVNQNVPIEISEPIHDNQKKEDKHLVNEYIINNLPSQLYDYKIIENSEDNFTNIFKSFKDKYLSKEALRDNLYINEYIMMHFKNHINTLEKKSFFDHETEYILYGNLGDNDNFKAFENGLFLMRGGMNLLHIYSDPVKRKQTMAAATIASGGVGTFFTQFLIASAWAGAEAEYDLDKLIDKERVAFVKTKESWVLSFDNFANKNKAVKRDILIKDKVNGFQGNMFSYEDYLRLFLIFSNEDKKLYRILDLVQINMKGRYYKDFETGNFSGACNTQVTFSVKYKFLNFSWMPNAIKNEIPSRRNIYVDVQHGY